MTDRRRTARFRRRLPKRDLVLDLRRLRRPGERLAVVLDRRPARADEGSLDREVKRQRAATGERRARRLDHAPPVGVAAVQRRFHERRVGDRARDGLDTVGLAAADDHPRDALGALAVGDHQDRELAQQSVEALAEAQLVFALGFHADAGGARAHQHGGVVGRQLPIHRAALERTSDAHAQQ